VGLVSTIVIEVTPPIALTAWAIWVALNKSMAQRRKSACSTGRCFLFTWHPDSRA
jgi:hypothetical protein